MHDSAFALACSAGLHVLAAFTLAAVAAASPLVGYFHQAAVVDLLESHVQCLLGGLDLLHFPSCRLPSATAAEEPVEDIVGVGFGSFGAVLVINPSLFWIGEGLICLADLFELNRCQELPSRRCLPSCPDGIFLRVRDTAW